MKAGFRATSLALTLGLCTMASLIFGDRASGALTAVREYDENEVATNTIQATAASSNVTVEQFKLDVAAAFDNGLGGVINYDNDPNWTHGQNLPFFDVTYASGTKTLTVDRVGDGFFAIAEASETTSAPTSGIHWQGFSGSASNVTLLFWTAGVDSIPVPVVEWGITGTSRSADRTITVTITHDDSSAYVFEPELISTPIGSDNTFFGYKAPAGRTIASIHLLSSGANQAYDDMGFILAPPPVAGDFDGDGDVDGADFVVWQTNFPTSEGATLADGDADGDGDVDGADFVVWQTNFPTSPGAAVTTVPEPMAAVLGALGGLAAIACPRRRVKIAERIKRRR